VIAIDGVTVRYEGAAALDDVSLHVDRGQWLAVVGPNGAGKTTLLRCLAHLARHLGVVRLSGRPIQQMSRRELARTVAYVPQRPTLPADMPVADYVLLGRTPHIGYLGSESAADRRICAELLGRLSLTALAGRRLGTLSGGELQRLVLARALAQQAPVLLLDEPTSALDLGRRVDALELVDSLRRERELTVVSAIHDLTLAGQFADVLALMNAGKMVATGGPKEVLREDLLVPLFGGGVEVLEHGGDLVVVSRRP
jgi:iron complex transport system ATP-binding protein